MKKLPKQIFVYWEEPGNDEPFLMCTTNIRSTVNESDKTRVGIYVFKEQQDVELVLKKSPVRKG